MDEYVSTFPFNDLPDDCITLVLERLAYEATLSELVQKAFVCERWFAVVTRFLATWRGTSLKLFDSDRNIETYRQITREFVLQRVDTRLQCERVCDWKRQDYLVLRQYQEMSQQLILDGVAIVFGHVDHLMINTLQVDYIELLRCFSRLESLTLLELPDCRKRQSDIWRQLATMSTLKNLHILHDYGYLSLNVEQLRPVLARLEMFTLVQYTHGNRLELLRCLTPEVCRRVYLGLFDHYQHAVHFRSQMPEGLQQSLIILNRNPEGHIAIMEPIFQENRFINIEERNNQMRWLHRERRLRMHEENDGHNAVNNGGGGANAVPLEVEEESNEEVAEQFAHMNVQQLIDGAQHFGQELQIAERRRPEDWLDVFGDLRRQGRHQEMADLAAIERIIDEEWRVEVHRHSDSDSDTDSAPGGSDADESSNDDS